MLNKLINVFQITSIFINAPTLDHVHPSHFLPESWKNANVKKKSHSHSGAEGQVQKFSWLQLGMFYIANLSPSSSSAGLS